MIPVDIIYHIVGWLGLGELTSTSRLSHAWRDPPRELLYRVLRLRNGSMLKKFVNGLIRHIRAADHFPSRLHLQEGCCSACLSGGPRTYTWRSDNSDLRDHQPAPAEPPYVGYNLHGGQLVYDRTRDRPLPWVCRWPGIEDFAHYSKFII